jgi:hypothetical protein
MDRKKPKGDSGNCQEGLRPQGLEGNADVSDHQKGEGGETGGRDSGQGHLNADASIAYIVAEAEVRVA